MISYMPVYEVSMSTTTRTRTSMVIRYTIIVLCSTVLAEVNSPTGGNRQGGMMVGKRLLIGNTM